MNYDIFLCDFDGTLVRGDGTISEKNRRAIEKYRNGGGIFAVCTGRMPASILPRLKELGIEEGLVVAYQGATVLDVATGKPLKNDGFTKEQAQRALRFLEGEDVHIHAYTLNDCYCNRDDEGLRIYEKVCGVTGIAVAEPLSDYVERNGLHIVKALAMLPPEEKEGLRLRAQVALGDEFFVTCSSDWLVEIMPAAQNKAAAADFLSAYYGVPLCRVAAIGDQLNDLPMIERAGGKFAVENAQEPLKKIARVVPSCEEDGVAYAIEKYAMGEQS